MKENNTNGKRNKAAGGVWERTCVKLLEEAGFKGLGTSRNISRTRDAEKVDICMFEESLYGRFELNVQAKTLSKAANYPKLLSEMPKGKEINVVFHKQTKKVGERFMPRGEYAITNLDAFLSIVANMKKYRDGYHILNTFFDCIPDDEKETTDAQLRGLGL